MEIFQDFGYKGETKKRAILWNHDLDLGGLCKSDLELAWETDDWEKKFICRTRLNSVGRCVMIEESKLYSFFTHTISDPFPLRFNLKEPNTFGEHFSTLFLLKLYSP